LGSKFSQEGFLRLRLDLTPLKVRMGVFSVCPIKNMLEICTLDTLEGTCYNYK
jgi:hypothetical protein